MATHYAVKFTYNMNGAPLALDAMKSMASTDPLWASEIPTWITEYEAYLEKHKWTGNDNVRIKYDIVDANTVYTTYAMVGATAENVETLQRMFIWSHDIHPFMQWKTAYQTARGAVLLNTEIITVDL